MNTIVKYGASWCTPCKQLDKTLAILEDSGVNVVKIDIDEFPGVAKSNSVKSVPTMIFLDPDDNEVGRLVGNQPIQEIRKMIGD